MKGMESSMKLVALGATQRRGKACMVEEWIRAPKYVGRRTSHISRGMDRDVIVMKYVEYG